MNLVARSLGIPAVRLAAGLALLLAAGCASSAPANRKVYDRYAELVAARNRAAPAATPAPAVAPVARPVAGPPASATSAPARSATAALATPAPSRPVPAAVPVQPAGTPVAAPVQVVPPRPAAIPSLPAAPTGAKLAPAGSPALPPPGPVPPAGSAVPESAAADGAYILKVGDGVQVFLRGIPSPEVIEDFIDEGGMITLPFLNEVPAANMRPSDLERTIRQAYLDLDIYRSINVNVVVPARFYFIQGEIRAPGRFQIMTPTRVSQAIAASGGYTEFASGRVVVKRRGKIIKTIRDARKLERRPEDDILLEPDDIVEVLRSWI